MLTAPSMQTTSTSDTRRIPSVVPSHLVTLYARVSITRSRDDIVATWARLRRALFAKPVRRIPLQRHPERFPAIDWEAQARKLGLYPTIVVAEEEEISGVLTQDSPVAAALALASLAITARPSFDELHDAARALVLIEGGLRRGIVADALHAIESLPVRDALTAIGFAEAFAEDRSILCSVAAATMAQSQLDSLTRTGSLRAVLSSAIDPRVVRDAVIGGEAQLIRRGQPPAESTLHARLVALACEEARLSFVDARACATVPG
jgi:hypothetical protein